MADRITKYGFTYGPAIVCRLAHIPDRGRSMEVFTRHDRIQIGITEKGRKITVHRLEPYEDYETMAAFAEDGS